MRAAHIVGPGRTAVLDVPAPETGPGDVLVRVHYVGLCGTDLELLHGTSAYLLEGRSSLPHSFGHEWVGVVADGHGTASLPAGSVVTGSTMVFCDECAACTSGRRNLCTHLTEVGLYGRGGAAAELLSVPARTLAQVAPPKATPRPEHVLVEPLATVLEALSVAPPSPGHRVLVVGAGTMGSLAVLALAEHDAVIDVAEPGRITHLPRTAVRRHVASTSDVTGPYDLVMECSGASAALPAALAALRPGGTCLLVGVASRPAIIDVGALALRGQRLVGVRHGVDHYGEAVALLGRQSSESAALVDTVVPLESIDTAFARLQASRSRPKVVVGIG